MTQSNARKIILRQGYTYELWSLKAMDNAGSIYRELRHIAKIHRRKWSGNSTLNTTALIHEAWLKMNPANGDYNDKTHFFATAARAMRQVLINYAERNSAQKRCSPVLTEE
ncbi:MAG TPA: ECF-type sigma factor, partial [Cyclobacteriaceae bacterium]|nr:ECF-type sigma factor [Cyclobacteriaceae bacterium]